MASILRLVMVTAFVLCFTTSSLTYPQFSQGLLQAEEFDCPTNVKLKENSCNKCFCTSEGELACTGYDCPENFGKGYENCTLHTSWSVGCNKCWCITIGQVCTDNVCEDITGEIVIK